MRRGGVLLLLVIAFLIVNRGFWSSSETTGEVHAYPPPLEKQLTSMPERLSRDADPADTPKDVVNPHGKQLKSSRGFGQEEVPPWDQLHQGDYWALISEHWPRAKTGDADSQVIVHSIMSFCALYKRRFEGKHLAEVQAEYSGSNDPNLFALNANVWDRCGKVYESWDRFNGWQGMREAAADNGQPAAMAWKGGALISDPETFDEGIRWLEAALASGDGSALVSVANIYSRARVDEKLAAAWLLAACKLGVNCSIVAESCGMYTDCGIHEPVQDVILRELGDGGYYVANQYAERIYEAIASGNIESLELAEDLRK